MTSRRGFLEQTALSALGLAVPPSVLGPVARTMATGPNTFLDLLRPPDRVMVQGASGDQWLNRVVDRWSGTDGVVATTAIGKDAVHVALSSPSIAIKRVHLRWRGSIGATRLILGDAWERGYGDLEWRGWVPDRVMPWYVATYDGTLTHGYGVRTGAAAFCFWQIDAEGISLWLDVRSGGSPLQLGPRTLDVCDVICRAGLPGESSFVALHTFCKQMCANPRLPSQPVYGSNDWYWAYGKNSADSVRADAQHIVELSPTGGNRPFVVIDDGWQPGRGATKAGTGTWDRGNDKFPDMSGLAADIKKLGGRAGIWTRPLQAPADAPDSWRLPRDRGTLDPSVPDVLRKVADDIGRLRQWGFELIKHDYSTYDILGRWGSTMGSAMTRDGWTFATGSSRTTAEVINDLYRTIRTAAAESLVIGCNTVSHLSAGQFEICRVGDDTSGTDWARTRKMGLNSLAFRGVQHGAFYVADADCVGVTNAIPWNFNRQWLDLLSRSGTMLMVSLAPDALGAEQRRDLKAALAMAARPQPLIEPGDWQHAMYPSVWTENERNLNHLYDWVGPDGAGGL